MNSNTLIHPGAPNIWWNDEEERGLFVAFGANIAVSNHLQTSHPRDALMAFMAGLECYFKYAYALTRYNAIQDVTTIQRVMRFLRIAEPIPNQYKCAAFKHDIRKIISELRRGYVNLAGRPIQDFMMSLPPNETTDHANLKSLSWMAFRYRDGGDTNVRAVCQNYLTDLTPKFQHIRANFFRGIP